MCGAGGRYLVPEVWAALVVTASLHSRSQVVVFPVHVRATELVAGRLHGPVVSGVHPKQVRQVSCLPRYPARGQRHDPIMFFRRSKHGERTVSDARRMQPKVSYVEIRTARRRPSVQQAEARNKSPTWPAVFPSH